jgi:hypothetical protein
MVMLPVAGRTASIRSLPFVEGACEARTPNPHVAAMADGPGEVMIEAPPPRLRARIIAIDAFGSRAARFRAKVFDVKGHIPLVTSN